MYVDIRIILYKCVLYMQREIYENETQDTAEITVIVNHRGKKITDHGVKALKIQ